jgi:O-antigen ligase
MKKTLLFCLMVSYLGGEIVRFTFFSSISFRVLDIVAFIIFLAFLLELITLPEKKQIIFTTTAKWLVAFFLIAGFSLLLNVDHFTLSQLAEGSLYLARFIMYSGVFFYFKEQEKDEERGEVQLLTLIGGLLILFGFIQYFYYNNLRNLYYLGWDDHMYRIFSVFLDPNFTGILFALFAIFLMGRLFVERNSKNKTLFWGLSLLFGLCLVATVMTFSRSALISLGVGSIVFLSLIGQKKHLFSFFGVMFGMLLLTTPFFYIENVNLFRAASTEARVQSAEIALVIIKDHFLTGVGFNTYRYVQIKYGFRQGIGAQVSHADSGTDNSYLFVLATTGIAGIVIYLGLLRSLILFAWKTYMEKKSIYSVIFISSLTAVMVDSLFINSLFYPFVIVWIWLLVGLVSYT